MSLCHISPSPDLNALSFEMVDESVCGDAYFFGELPGGFSFDISPDESVEVGYHNWLVPTAAPIGLIPWNPSTFARVLTVMDHRPIDQVVGVTARRVVTRMATHFGPVSVRQPERDTMRCGRVRFWVARRLLSRDKEHAITLATIHRPRPALTLAAYIDLSPKPIVGRFSLAVLIAKLRAKLRPGATFVCHRASISALSIGGNDRAMRAAAHAKSAKSASSKDSK